MSLKQFYCCGSGCKIPIELISIEEVACGIIECEKHLKPLRIKWVFKRNVEIKIK